MNARGFWTFEVPAPNGTMDFAAGTPVMRTQLTPQSDAACLTIVDAPTATTPMPLPMTLVDVTVEPLMPAMQTQS